MRYHPFPFPESDTRRAFNQYNALIASAEQYCRLQPEARTAGCHVVTTPYFAEPVLMHVVRVRVGQTVNYRVSVTR